MPNTKPENQKTRPDLDDKTWIVWTSQQPENKGIEVPELYRKMLEWCLKNGKTPTRLRLLNWLKTERESMPMTYEPPYFSSSPPYEGGVADASADGVVLSSRSRGCTYCNGTARVQVNDFSSPCPTCRPTEEKAFWKARGR